MSCLTFERCVSKDKGKRAVVLFFQCSNGATFNISEEFSCDEGCQISFFIKQCCQGDPAPPLEIIHALEDGSQNVWLFTCSAGNIQLKYTLRIDGTPLHSCTCLMSCGHSQDLAGKIDSCCSCGV